MLKKLNLNHTNRPILHFLSKLDGEDIFELSPSYQRSSVWTTAQRRNLIKSLLMGIPVGAIVTNLRGYDTNKLYAVVDGKQRIETFRSFAAGDLSVPADWFDAEDVLEAHEEDGVQMVRYGGLARPGQRQFENTPVATLEAQVKGEAAEAEIFLLINSAGTSQTDEDLARAAAIAGA